MWLTGSYDADLNTLYWTVGNPGAQIDRSVRGERRQSIHRFRRRAGSRYGAAQMAFSIHAERRPRLGFRARRGPRRSHVARPKSQAAASRRSQRHVLRARPDQRKISLRHSIRLSELEQRPRRKRPADPGSWIELEPGRQLPGLSLSWRRHQFPGALVQSGHRLVISRILRKRATRRRARRLRTNRAVNTSAVGAATRRRRDQTIRQPSAGIKALDPETGKTMWDFKLFQGSLSTA